MNLKHLLTVGLGCAFLLSVEAATNSTASAAAEPTRPCFQCNATGKMKCSVPGCKNGEADCPGPCLKLSKGSWVHLQVDGHDPNELWQKFYKAGGEHYTAWNQNH